MNRPGLGITVSTWPEANIWEQLHLDLDCVKDQGTILVTVDVGSVWIEDFPGGNRTSETVKVYLSQVFPTRRQKVTFIIRKSVTTSFIQPKNSARTNHVSDNRNSRLDEDNAKTEPPVEETISEPQLQHRDVGPSNQKSREDVILSMKHHINWKISLLKIQRTEKNLLEEFSCYVGNKWPLN